MDSRWISMSHEEREDLPLFFMIHGFGGKFVLARSSGRATISALNPAGVAQW